MEYGIVYNYFGGPDSYQAAAAFLLGPFGLDARTFVMGLLGFGLRA